MSRSPVRSRRGLGCLTVAFGVIGGEKGSGRKGHKREQKLELPYQSQHKGPVPVGAHLFLLSSWNLQSLPLLFSLVLLAPFFFFFPSTLFSFGLPYFPFLIPSPCPRHLSEPPLQPPHPRGAAARKCEKWCWENLGGGCGRREPNNASLERH